MSLTLTLALAVALDYCLGEPRPLYHPLVAFGKWATAVEKGLLHTNHSSVGQKIAGVLAILRPDPCLAGLFYLPNEPILLI